VAYRSILKALLANYKGNRIKLLLDVLRDEIRPAKAFEPEP